MSNFTIKDSNKREEFDSGMVRDTEDDKTDYTNLLHGPMFDRWAEHLTRAKPKYPDPEPGVPNWTLAEGAEELHRYRRSAFRHFKQWMNGETDEDHAAAVFFNINGVEYVQDKLNLAYGPGAMLSRNLGQRVRETIYPEPERWSEYDDPGYEDQEENTTTVEGID